MSEGTGLSPVTRNENEERTSVNESLQGYKPASAPGVSSDEPVRSDSRLGLFRVLAGIKPGTSTEMADQQPLHNSAAGNSLFTQPGLHNLTRGLSDVAGGTSTHMHTGVSSYPRVSCDPRFKMAAALDTGISCDPRFNMASALDTGISCDPRFNMAPALDTGISCDPRFNMAAPSPMNQNNNIMMMLFEQCKETKDLYKQQQVALDNLTKAVSDMNQNRSEISQANSANYQGESDGSDDDVSQPDHRRYEMVSDEELSENESDQEPPQKKKKLSADCDSRLIKLKAMESQFVKKEEFGPAVHEVVASTVNKGLSQPIDHKSEVVQDLVKKYNRPENCEFLDVPKVNKLVWTSKQTGRDLKQVDRSLQKTQSYLTKGMIPLITILNKSLDMKSDEAKEIFDLSIDAFNLLAYAHGDLSSHRRRQLMPAISTRYATLCNESEKISSPTHLFGDDKALENKLKEIDDSQKLGKNLSFVPASRSKQYRTDRNTGQKWATKEHSATRNSATPSRPFLEKRPSFQKPAYQQHRAGNRKVEQGPKKNRAYQKQ